MAIVSSIQAAVLINNDTDLINRAGIQLIIAQLDQLKMCLDLPHTSFLADINVRM